jgi:outer membrane protein TolC
VGTSTAQIPSLVEDHPIRFYNTDTTLMFTQPLLKGFGRGISRRALTTAEMRAGDATRQQRLAEQQVTVDVASAYYRVVAQNALVDVARRSFDRARQLRDSSEAKLNAGLVSQLDALRAQQLVSQAEMQLFDAQGTLEDSRDQLRFLIGRESGDPINVITEIPTLVDRTPGDEAVATGLSRRLDLQGLLAEAADAENAISYAHNQLLPQVDVNLALTRRQTADTFGGSFGVQGYQFATFLTISMPVDRTPQAVEYQNALIDRDRRRRDGDTMKRRIADDIRRQIRERDRVQRNFSAADSNLLVARQEVDVARLRYERGLSDNLDVVTAESNLMTAENRRLLALVDLAMNRLTLRATMGVLDPERDTTVTASPAQ